MPATPPARIPIFHSAPLGGLTFGSRIAALLCFVSAILLTTPALSATVDEQVQAFLDSANRTDTLPVIVRLAEREDLARHRSGPRRERRRRMIRALKDKANRTQPILRRLLRNAGKDRARSLWSINALAVEVTPPLLRRLLRYRAVERVDFDDIVQLSGASGAPSGPVEWNLDMIRAPEVWSLGFEGEGVVIGIIDSGVDMAHPELAATWRGGTNSWNDLIDVTSTPHDTGGGHGTQVAGLLVGGTDGGTHIGVAPSAEWIAARAFDSNGEATFSDLHLALQWTLDPDSDPLTDDAPDVVNNSWGIEAAPGVCISEFSADIDLLRAAGIAVLFAAGNTGPGTSTDVSPGNTSNTLAVGAVNSSADVPIFTAQGPSSCDSALFPNVVAPGVSVRTTDRFILPPAYVNVSGTSFSVPHVSAMIALLLEAFPATTLVEMENVLEMTAQDVALVGPDNYTGYGIVDARSALGTLVSLHGCPSGAFAADSDSDGVLDACDLCTSTANSGQRDSDADGFGNFCDSDLNQDLIVNFGDLGAFAIAFGTTDPHADFNGDGVVNFGDLAIFAVSFGLPPGPSGFDY